MASLIDELAQRIPSDRLLTRPGALAAYETDGLTAVRGRPRAVVIAESQQEVIDTVRLCYAAAVPFMTTQHRSRIGDWAVASWSTRTNVA